jgi:S-adenosylmethionine-dependent methyltransferase
MTDPYARLADRFVRHYDTLRGVVRRQLVARQMSEHLPAPPARVADVGGGAGHVAVALAAAGYDVTVLDPSPDMLSRARRAAADLPDESARRVHLVEGWGEDAPELLGSEAFAVAVCHGVVMYVEDPEPLLQGVCRLLEPGGVLSVVAKNAAALALRPALLGLWRDARAAFDADRDVGGLGVVTRGDTVGGLSRILQDVGVDVVAWYGVRVLTDHLLGHAPPDELEDVLAAEWEAGRRDPYRSVGRLFHLIGRRR